MVDIRRGYEPGMPGTYGGISKRAKLAIPDVANVLTGAVPLTPEMPVAAMDIVTFEAVPPGVMRAYVRGTGLSDGANSLMVFRVLDTISTNFMDIDAAPGIDSAVNLRPIVLRHGEVLQCHDYFLTGNNVVASVGYVDIEVM